MFVLHFYTVTNPWIPQSPCTTAMIDKHKGLLTAILYDCTGSRLKSTPSRSHRFQLASIASKPILLSIPGVICGTAQSIDLITGLQDCQASDSTRKRTTSHMQGDCQPQYDRSMAGDDLRPLSNPPCDNGVQINRLRQGRARSRQVKAGNDVEEQDWR